MKEQISPPVLLQEMSEEQSLDFVPRSFDQYLGQSVLKQKLALFTAAARLRNEPLDHLLLFGPPGLGKTTLARIMAHVLEVNIKICSGPTLERSGDLVAILTNLQPKDILFIDEIHRVPAAVEEVLYGAMEEFRVDLIVGQGAGARAITIPVSPFTLIGATTKSGMISAPLRTRFGIVERLEYYTIDELASIVQQAAEFLGVVVDVDAALYIAGAARGTPRIAKKITRRVRDYAQINEQAIISFDMAQKALEFLGVDAQGLTAVDWKICTILIEHYRGGPVGIETLAAMVGEDVETLEEVYEPYLLRIGLLEKTSRGRQIPGHKIPILLQKIVGQSFIK